MEIDGIDCATFGGCIHLCPESRYSRTAVERVDLEVCIPLHDIGIPWRFLGNFGIASTLIN